MKVYTGKVYTGKVYTGKVYTGKVWGKTIQNCFVFFNIKIHQSSAVFYGSKWSPMRGGVWKGITTGQTVSLFLVDKHPGLTFTEAKPTLPAATGARHSPSPLLPVTTTCLWLQEGPSPDRVLKCRPFPPQSAVGGIHLPTIPEAMTPILVPDTHTCLWPKLAPGHVPPGLSDTRGQDLPSPTHLHLLPLLFQHRSVLKGYSLELLLKTC